MLHELKATQPEQDRVRRWFADDYFDLIVWMEKDGGLLGFQLCYDKGGRERALTWTETEGFSHDCVDSGEELPTENRSPILVSSGDFKYKEILKRFKEHSESVETEIRSLVVSKISEFASSYED